MSYEKSSLQEQFTTSEEEDLLVEAFLYFRAQLQHWIWRSKDGEKLLRTLEAWRTRHPGGGNRRLVSKDNSYLSTELRRYLINHQEKWFLVRWIYWIFTPIYTWETMKRGLSILLAVDKALVETIENPLGSQEEEVVSSEGGAEALLRYQSQHFYIEGSLAACLQQEFEIRPWFGFFRGVMGQIHQAIENYEKKKTHQTSLGDEAFRSVNSDIPEDLRRCIQTYHSQASESRMPPEDTPLLPVNPVPTNTLPWPHDVGASISAGTPWAWLKGKTSSLTPSEFSRREKLLRAEINDCLETLNQCFSASSESQIRTKGFFFHIKRLIQLLWDASYLEKNKPSWWERQARGYTEDRDFWHRLAGLKNELSCIAKRHASQPSGGAQFSVLITELISLRNGSNDWLLRHRTIVQGFYQDKWLRDFDRYEIWKSQHKDLPSHAAQGKELEERCLELGNLFFEATRVLSQREASRCRQQLMMTLRGFQQCLKADPEAFEQPVGERGSSFLHTPGPHPHPQPTSHLTIRGASVSLANEGSDSEDGDPDPEEEMVSFPRPGSSFLMSLPSASPTSPFPMVLVPPLPSSSTSPSTSGSVPQGEKTFSLQIAPDDMAFIRHLTTPYPQELRETPQGLELEERLKGLKETMLIVDYIRLLKLLRVFSHPDKAARFYTNLEAATQGFKALNALWSREEKRIIAIYQGLEDGTLRPKRSISEQLDELEGEFAKRRQELEEIAKELKAFQASCKEFNEEKERNLEMLREMFKQGGALMEKFVEAKKEESEARQRSSEAMQSSSEAMQSSSEEMKKANEANRILLEEMKRGNERAAQQKIEVLKQGEEIAALRRDMIAAGIISTSSLPPPLPSSSGIPSSHPTETPTIVEAPSIAEQGEPLRRPPSPRFFDPSAQSSPQTLRSSPGSPTRTP